MNWRFVTTFFVFLLFLACFDVWLKATPENKRQNLMFCQLFLKISLFSARKLYSQNQELPFS